MISIVAAPYSFVTQKSLQKGILIVFKHLKIDCIRMERGTFYCGHCNLIFIQKASREYCSKCYNFMTMMPVYVIKNYFFNYMNLNNYFCVFTFILYLHRWLGNTIMKKHQEAKHSGKWCELIHSWNSIRLRNQININNWNRS